MKLDEILRHAREVGRKTAYPITSADKLVDALCGDQATQPIGNKDHQVAKVRQIPATYFPFEKAIWSNGFVTDGYPHLRKE